MFYKKIGQTSIVERTSGEGFCVVKCFFILKNPVFPYISRDYILILSYIHISMFHKKYSFLFLPLLLLVPSTSFAFVTLVCDLCTLGVVAGLSISRYLWVDDSVVGVWVGACIVALIIMTNAYLEKKNIRFRFRDTVIALSYVVFSYGSLYYAGVIGLYRNTFLKSTSIFLDKILISSVIGGGVLIGGSLLYQFLKARNNNKAHFPFEKVAIPLVLLTITSALFYFITLR